MEEGPVYDIAGLEVLRGLGTQRFRLRVPRLRVERGARLALTGPSGCGKSTLLDILALLAAPARADRFSFAPAAGGPGVDLRGGVRESGALARLRGCHIGYVPQVGGLLPALTVRQNVALPRRLLGLREDGGTDRLLDRLGIARHADKRPASLSVGERQRVAIARALAHGPAVVAADEPTAALDPYASDAVMNAFLEAAEAVGATLLIVSHDLDRVARFGLSPVPQTFAQTDDGAVVSVFGEAA